MLSGLTTQNDQKFLNHTRNSIRQKLFYFLILYSLFFIPSCRGFDNDESFFPKTTYSFFFCSDSIGKNTLNFKGNDGNYYYHFNETLGIQDEDLSDVNGNTENLWIASGNNKLIIHIDYSGKDSEVKTYSNLNIHPHYICPGENYLLISDTIENKTGFLKIRNGELTLVDAGGKPGMAGYNSGKFYLDIEKDIQIIPEQTFSSSATVEIGNRILEIQVDRNRSIHIFNSDDSLNYETWIDPNGDLAVTSNYSVAYSEVRYCSWLTPTYGIEYMEDVFLNDSTLNPLVYPNPVGHFEIDFFESRFFFSLGDSLTEFDYSTNGSVETTFAFPFVLKKAFFMVDWK